MANKVYPVGGKAIMVEVTPTLTVSASYAANDYVGSSSDDSEYASAALYAGGSGWISGAILIDYALQSVACELWLFDTTVTPPADSAAWSISDADAKNCVAVIPFTTYRASALNSVAHGDELPKKFVCASGSTSLYGCLVTRGAPTLTSGDYTVRLMIDYD